MTQSTPVPTTTAPISLPPDLDTPRLVLDAARMQLNIDRMARLAGAAGVGLRPHAKTHKCVPVALRQLAAGASGLTVATLAEAESFADGGCDDLFIAYPLWAGEGRAVRLRALHEHIRLRVGVDGAEAAEVLAAAVRGAERPLEVLIEIDCGGRRTGVLPADAATLAAFCQRLGLRVLGAFTHPGHTYAGNEAAADAAGDERRALASAADALRPLLDAAPIVSGGSTPTVIAGIADPLTEIRPGAYVFGDRQQLHLSRATVDQIAVVVAARVVSAPRPGEVVLDSGSKALSTDRPAWLDGFGWLPELPAARLVAITEEHAVVRGVRDELRVGQLVAVVPNHICTAVNLGSEFTVVDGGTVVDTWRIDSRTGR